MIGAAKFLAALLLSSPISDRLPPAAQSGVIEGGTLSIGGTPSTLSIMPQQAYPYAASGTGANLWLAGGIGLRLATSVSNTAGTVTVTIETWDGTGYHRTALASGTNFTLGSDNTAAQLHVTAVNLAAAVNANATLSADVVADATSSGAIVYWTHKSGCYGLKLITSSSGRISVTNGNNTTAHEGAVMLPTLPQRLAWVARGVVNTDGLEWQIAESHTIGTLDRLRLGYNLDSTTFDATAPSLGLFFDVSSTQLSFYLSESSPFGTNGSLPLEVEYTRSSGASQTGVAGQFSVTPSINTNPAVVGCSTANFCVSDAAAGSATITIGNGGAGIKKHLTGTATLDFANQAAIGCEVLTITVTGAASGDTVALGVPNGSNTTNSTFYAWVSSSGTVSVKHCAVVSGDPASGTFRADVWQH